jgi:hypothetical protein
VSQSSIEQRISHVTVVYLKVSMRPDRNRRKAHGVPGFYGSVKGSVEVSQPQ